jgi:hypothetical protein
LNFGCPFLRSRQYEGDSDRETRMSDHAKSAVRMRIRGEAVCMNDLYCRQESDQQQADNSENPVSEEYGARLGSRLGHQILNLELKKEQKSTTLDEMLTNFVIKGQPTHPVSTHS